MNVRPTERVRDAPGTDARGRKILLDTYWSPAGWRDDRRVGADDFAAAKAAGYMFDAEWSGHDAAVTRARARSQDLTPAVVGAAFAASLSTRRLEWRSALGSYAIASRLPAHEAAGDPFCRVCGALVAEGARET